MASPPPEPYIYPWNGCGPVELKGAAAADLIIILDLLTLGAASLILSGCLSRRSRGPDPAADFAGRP